ncbi:MAG: HAMP domain-containing protein [Armatimonadetes bacterium]|nr:HAMP domain-containing protein [Anaerolineae bacterium]
MSIQVKVIASITGIFVALFIGLFVLSQSLLLTSYEQLEQDFAQRDIERIQNVLEENRVVMLSVLETWAGWDDTYEFVQGNYPDYVDVNLADETMINLEINVLALLNAEGQLMVSRVYDLGEALALPPLTGSEPFLADARLITHPNEESVISGFMHLNGETALVVSLPIIRSDFTGPIEGTLLAVRYLDANKSALLSEELRLQMQVFDYNADSDNAILTAAKGSLIASGTVVTDVQNDTLISGYTRLDDLFGQPLAIVQADLEREIYARGLQTIQVMRIIILAMAVAVIGTVLLLLKTLVLDRVTQLSNEVDAIESRGTLNRRVTQTAQDEITHLASNINRMLGRLDQSQHTLTAKNDALALAVQQAQDASRLKSEFLSTMSHELRTPLNAIMGYSGIMLEGIGGELDVEAQRMVGSINDSSRHLLTLINDILDLSRIEAGRVEIVDEDIDLRMLMDKLHRQMGVLADQKNLHFDVHVEDDIPPFIRGDQERLTQILINLISNAIKFTPRGAVGIYALRNGNTLVLRVRDTGIGIPAHAQDYIFEEFRQVDGSSKRSHEGTGLGLAIVRKLAQAMGGGVSVQSTLGSGSIFTLSLPLREGAGDLASEPVNAEQLN